MKNVLFRDAPIPSPAKGAFDLSCEQKLSAHIGRLVPFKFFETVPGDKFRINTSMLVKMAPMLAPLMHRIDAYVHWFFVPNRLIMPGAQTFIPWKDFITGDPHENYVAGGYDTPPYITINNTTKTLFSEYFIADYLGLPVIDNGTTVTQDIDINVMPFQAYHLIYDNYFRDENLVDPVCGLNSNFNVRLYCGDMNAYASDILLGQPYMRAYEKDYFKGALPNAYMGSADDVEIDLDAPDLVYTRNSSTNALTTGAPTAVDIDTSGRLEISGGANINISGTTSGQATLATLEISELRRANALMRFFEAKNRGGHRYNEYVLGVFGVIPDNSELDYPQYLGGGKQAMQISAVINQSVALDPTAGVNDGVGGTVEIIEPQSYETGRGYAAGRSNMVNFYGKEHGIIMGIFSVLPRTAYGGAQIERYWRKLEYTDFFVPQLQNIGDQDILQSEIGYDATGTDADDVFGYAPRWAEYKFSKDTVHGEFLSDLDFWHMGEIGDTSGAGPDLNQVYIECYDQEDAISRVFADTSWSHKLYVNLYNDVKAIRPMYVHDIPK